MSEIVLCTSSDEHLADQNPSFRKDDYKSAILTKLEWQGEFARRAGARAFIRAGDFFHVKPANKTTMATMAKAAGIHRRYPCDTWSVAGNHDMSYNDPSTVPGQPLGVLFSAGVFKPLTEQVFESGSLKVRVVGVEYTADIDHDHLVDLVRKRPDDQYVVAVVHALAAMAPPEKIQSFFNERVFDYRDLVFDGCPDAYVFGHYHKDQGIVDHLGTRFVNLGAVSRGALTFENLDRQPKMSLLKFDSRGLSAEEIVIPHKDPSEIFDLEKKKQVDRERRAIDDFISLIRSDKEIAGAKTYQDKLAHFRSSPEYPDDLKRCIVETLEAAEAGDGE